MTSNLIDVFRELPASGSEGFEGLISSLLDDLTGHHFRLASAGYQAGRDMTARVLNGNIIAVECKRYGQDSELHERSLLGEMVQAVRNVPGLDLWVLVTSRDISSRLYESLNQQAADTGIGFFTLSDADGTPGSLEILCANSPDVFLNHPSIESRADRTELKNTLTEILQSAHFARRLSELRHYFVSPLAGYNSWRCQNNDRLLKSLASTQEARARFGQAINVAQPGVQLVPRTSFSISIANWYADWKDSHSFLSVLGEEGDGKTWGTASWLSNAVKQERDFPAVLFIPSIDIANGLSGPDVGELLIAQIVRTLSLSREHATRRLERWITRSASATPLIVLVLDGMNERGDREWWRRLLEQLAGETWNNHVAVIFTCRTTYWERHFKPLAYLPVKSFVIGPFNDAELTVALGYHNLSRDSMEPRLLPMIRKPRYFDQLVRLREKLPTGGDVTPARLLFEDWRDRYERKANLVLSVEEFQNVIRRLAEQHQAAAFTFTEHELTAALPESSRHAVLEELRTGGVLVAVGGKYHINKQSLVHGLALLLVDQLREAVSATDDPQEVIAKWMEPHAEMDLKAEIAESAVLYVLGSDILPINHKVALLEWWIGSSNPGSDAAEHLIAYLPRDPEAYTSLAESVWSDDYDNQWAQEILTFGFIDRYQYPFVSSILRTAFERWLGFVHIEGSPIQRRKPEDGARLCREISERLGREVEPGPLNLGRFTLTIISDDGLLRLSRVALAVISHHDRLPFVPALSVGCLADVVMGYPFNYECTLWVIRTSQTDLRESLQTRVEELLALETEIGRRAAIRLLSFEGSASAKDLINSIPLEKVRSEIMQRHEEDPCTSPMQWKRDESLKCLQRQDINPIWAARQIASYVVDPVFAAPQSFIQRLIEVLKAVKKDQVWVVLGPTSEDHEIDTIEPTLASHAPVALSEFVRSIVLQIATRTGMARRQLSIALVSHYLILQGEEQKAIKAAWENIIANADEWSKEDEHAEMFLMEVLLSLQGPQDQLSSLLRRPKTAANLIRYENNFLPLISFDTIRTQVKSETELEVLHRILWFLAAHPTAIPSDLFDTTILPLIDNDDSIVRSKVLELTYLIKSPKGIDLVINGNWTWNESTETFENHWGSLVLCEHGKSLTFEQVSRRIDPTYLGYALTCRGTISHEVMQYAQILYQMWLRLTKSGADLPFEWPQFVIESSVNQRIEQVPRWSLSEPSNASITIASKYLSWGGIESASDFDLSDWNFDATVKKHKNLKERVREVIAQQKKSGNIWFGRDFRGAGLEDVIAIRPDLVDEWIANANPKTPQGRESIRRGGAFYDALCAACLRNNSEQGVKLYWQLMETPARTVVRDSDTQIDLLDYALFDTAQNEFVTAAWQRKLEGCQSDQELMRLVLLLERAGASEWLWSYVDNGIDNVAPIERARSRVLLGFMNGSRSLALLEQLHRNDPETWMKELTDRALSQQQKRKWSKDWFIMFLTESSNASAWGAFRLLLRCIDSSFWFWWVTVKDQIKPSPDWFRRIMFTEDNSDNLRNAIVRNEKDIAERLFAQKIMKRQVWPWL